MDNIPSLKHVSDFYDKFSDYQKKSGYNIRLRTILKNLKKEGLKRNSSILEIGCGIGIFTQQLGNYVRSGKIVSTDISPKSVEIAKALNKNFSNIEFHVTDMSHCIPGQKFDYILLADVLEHIPLHKHTELFFNINKNLNTNGKVIINIPSPYHIEWQQMFEPESLQIIDQALSTDKILPAIYQNQFYLFSLKTYSLFFEQGDYQWIILKRNENIQNFKKRTKSSLRLQEIKSRMFNIFF